MADYSLGPNVIFPVSFIGNIVTCICFHIAIWPLAYDSKTEKLQIHGPHSHKRLFSGPLEKKFALLVLDCEGLEVGLMSSNSVSPHFHMQWGLPKNMQGKGMSEGPF